MTPAALRQHALSLPETHEAPHFERTSFRVGKKIFATMTADGTEAMVTVRPAERLEALLATHPDIFFDYGAWTWKNGAVGVRLRKVAPALMRELVSQAWEHIAPKRAIDARAGKTRRAR